MILYQLQPFVRLFQACGIIPFSVHVDVETSSLKEFTFSLRHPVFWWFAIAIVWHIACPLIPILFVNLYVKEKLNRYDETPIAVIVFMAMSVIIWYLIHFSLRWSSLQFKRLKRILECLIRVEKILFRCKDELNITTFNSKATLGAAIVVALVRKSWSEQFLQFI